MPNTSKSNVAVSVSASQLIKLTTSVSSMVFKKVIAIFFILRKAPTKKGRLLCEKQLQRACRHAQCRNLENYRAVLFSLLQNQLDRGII